MISILERIPDALEACLLHLCECIEDCEYPQVIIRVLHVLAQHGPDAVAPARFIRFIYNRIILEDACVRAAAVEALGQFAGRVESVRKSVVELLRGCLKDENDEVRARVVVALTGLQGDASMLFARLPLSPAQLHASLLAFQQRPDAVLDWNHLPVVEEKKASVASSAANAGTAAREEKKEEKVEASASELYQIPAFAAYGALVRSSSAVSLTEAETEYHVRVIKHVFREHVVLQFVVSNTIEGQVMCDVHMELHLEEGDAARWNIDAILPCKTIGLNEEKSCFVSLSVQPSAEEVVPEATFSAMMKFVAKDVEEDELEALDEIEGFDEEYEVETFDVGFGDFVARPLISDYRKQWEALSGACEEEDQVGLSFEDVSTAVKEIVSVLGLYAYEGTDRVAMGVGVRRGREA